MDDLNFQKNGITKAEKEFAKLKIITEQRFIIEALSKALIQHIPISLLGMQGFLYRAVVDWQKVNKKNATEIALMTPEQRIKSVTQIFNFLKQQLIPVLINKKEKYKIDEAMQEVLKFYKKNFAYR